MYDPHWMHIQIYADIAPTCSPTNKQQRLYETMSDVTVTMNKYEQMVYFYQRAEGNSAKVVKLCRAFARGPTALAGCQRETCGCPWETHRPMDMVYSNYIRNYSTNSLEPLTKLLLSLIEPLPFLSDLTSISWPG